MNDSQLKKIAITASLIGIVILAFISYSIEIPESSISHLSKEDEGRTIKVTGIVKDINQKEKITTIVIAQDAVLKAVLFDKPDTMIAKGEKITFIGELRYYKGKKELIINSIENSIKKP